MRKGLISVEDSRINAVPRATSLRKILIRGGSQSPTARICGVAGPDYAKSKFGMQKLAPNKGAAASYDQVPLLRTAPIDAATSCRRSCNGARVG